VAVCTGCTNAIEKLGQRVGRVESSLADVRTFQAEQTSKLSTLESQLRSMSGRLEELEYAQRQKSSSLDSLQSDISTLRKRVPPPPIVPAALLEEDENNVGRLPSELAEPIGEGLQLMREGNFEKARSFWDDAIYLGSGTEWAAMAMFWRGIALEGLNEQRKALETYLDIVARYPKYDRVPVVLLRQASVLIQLRDTKTARLTLNKLIADFPKSEQAGQARARLKDIK